MTKAEFYKSLIDIHKKHGQGLSGIVKAKSSECAMYLDELIEEGLVKMCDTGGSLGHPESNRFYMPTKGYNVWEDDGGEYSRHKGKYLHFVRVYLGCLDFEERESTGDEQEDLKRKFLNPTMFDYIRDPEAMKRYSEWLEKNHEELEIMRTLDDFYDAPVINFEDSEIEFIKSRGWYKDNKTVSECLKSSQKGKENEDEYIEVSKKLINLYKKGGDKYESDLEKSLKDVADTEIKILMRRKIHKWFNGQDQEAKIQELI